MKTTYAADLLHSLPGGTAVEFYGWVKARRGHSRVVFLDIADSTGTVQCVIEDGNKAAFELARHISQETAAKVTGILTDTGRPNTPKEIRVLEIEIIGPSAINVSPYPRSDIDILDPKLQEQILD